MTEQFRVAVEAAPSGMVLIDEEGTIQLVNAQVERLFGYTRDELIGRSVEILVPDVAKDSHGALRARFMAEPQARQMGADAN
ncbi:MAG: PAS domain S-box protein [Nitrospiraceae bacterium]